MASKKESVDLLEAYLKDLESFYHNALPDLVPSDSITPSLERIIARVPSEKKQNQMLVDYAERLLSKAKKCKSSMQANRFNRRAELLKDPVFRSKRSSRLVARKRRLAELDMKRIAEKTNAVNARTGQVALIARENGYDGKLFINTSANPTSPHSIKRFGEQIKTLHILIAAINHPDRSIIPDGVELLSVSQVAHLLGWGESVVRQRDKRGLLPMPFRIGGTTQWHKKELEFWIKRGCPPRIEWELIKQRKDI